MNMYDLPLESMRLCWLHYGILRIPSQFLGSHVFPCNLGAVFEVQAFDLFFRVSDKHAILSCLKHFPVGLHWILRCSWILCGTLYYRTGKYSEFWKFRNLASKQVAHIQMMKGEDAVALQDLWNTLGDVFVFWREGFGVGISCFALPLYNAEFLGQRCADWAQLGWEMSNSWPEACTNCNANLPPGGASPILALIE